MIARSKGGLIREVDVCRTIPEIGARVPTVKITTLLGKEGASLIASEKKRFQKALIDARGDRTKAAKLLKISRATFFRRAKELGLSRRRGLDL